MTASNVSEGLRKALTSAYDTGWRDHEAGIRPRPSEIVATRLAALAHAAPEGLTCLDYAAHDWNSNGSPSFCRQCWVEWPRLEAARRRLSQPDATEEAGR